MHAGDPSGVRSDGSRAALIVIVLIGASIAVSVLKPWGRPSPTPALPGVVSASPIATPSGAPPTQAAGPSEVTSLPPAAVLRGFTTPMPPGQAARWTGLRWRRLAPDDPLALVVFVVGWQGGFLAVGYDRPDVSGASQQLLWTSRDGSAWEPLPIHGTGTFPPGSRLVGSIVAIPGGLAAVTEGSLTRGDDVIEAWISTDARHWHAVAGADVVRVPPGTPPPLLSSGPAGLVLASVSSAAEGPGQATPTIVGSLVLRATEASGWRFTDRAHLPARFELTSLRGTAHGYLAVGLQPESGSENCAATGATCVAATLWSADGLHWPNTPTPLPTPRDPHPGVGPAIAFVQAGHDGLLVREAGEVRSERWWHSADGRRWRLLPSYPPLGSTDGDCDSIACYTKADGQLVDDGQRFVALRLGHEPGAWISTDGAGWRPLTMTGELPADANGYLALLPGGLIFSDGTDTWFGEAILH